VETFSDKSDQKVVSRMKKKAADNGERDFETGLEKILRQHRFGDKNKGGGAPGEKNTRPKTNEED
jgi:hypothetical protein